MPTPDLLLGADAREPMVAGFTRLADLLAITLGPLQGGIVATRDLGAPLDVLTDSATIARRFLSLPGRAESAGAMIMRNLVWRLHQSAGDGCATAAVLARALVLEGHRYMAAGVDAAALRQGIEAGAAAAIDALRLMARPVTSEETLRHVAAAVTGDEPMAAILAEIFDLLGPDAHVEVEEYVAPYLEREYLAGGRWQARLASPYLISDPVRQRAALNDCLVALYEGDLATAADVAPLLELALQQGLPRLLVAARSIKGEALATLVINHQREQARVVAVELRRTGDELADDFADLAALTGARLYRELTDRPGTIRADGLGRALRAEAEAAALVIIGAGAGAASRRERLAQLRVRLDALPTTEREAAGALGARIARLAGATATLKVGAIHKVEREALRQQADRAVQALRLALRAGVAPGGGVAYLACADAVRAAPCSGDAVYGRAAVATALEAPFRQIVANAGRRDPGAALAEARHHGPGWGYDALRDEIVAVEPAGIVDPAAVLARALGAAASGAAMLITTDALILKRNPQLSMEP